jgi:hypothetical protein
MLYTGRTWKTNFYTSGKLYSEKDRKLRIPTFVGVHLCAHKFLIRWHRALPSHSEFEIVHIWPFAMVATARDNTRRRLTTRQRRTRRQISVSDMCTLKTCGATPNPYGLLRRHYNDGRVSGEGKKTAFPARFMSNVTRFPDGGARRLFVILLGAFFFLPFRFDSYTSGLQVLARRARLPPPPPFIAVRKRWRFNRSNFATGNHHVITPS